MKQGAHFSEDKRYRYSLWRIWDESKPLVMFIGLNPSTANETDNDRIREFKIMNGLISIFFAALFCTMQVNGEDLEMRRSSSRVRTSRTTSRTRSRKD